MQEACKNASGIHDKIKNNIIIFANNNSDRPSLENSLFHENVHKWLNNNLTESEQKLFLEAFWKEVESNEGYLNLRNVIKEEYDEPDWPEEMFASALGIAMRNGQFKRIDKCISGVVDGEKIVEKILNQI